MLNSFVRLVVTFKVSLNIKSKVAAIRGFIGRRFILIRFETRELVLEYINQLVIQNNAKSKSTHLNYVTNIIAKTSYAINASLRELWHLFLVIDPRRPATFKYFDITMAFHVTR